MPRKSDLAGHKFGLLTVVGDSGERRGTCVLWTCRCDCGVTIAVPTTSLTKGLVKSCGCVRSVRKSIFSKPQWNNTSGVRGVHLKSSKGRSDRWTAVISLNRKQYYLGSYRHFDAAVKARKAAEEHIEGSFEEWYLEWRKKTRRTKKSPDPV